MILVNAEYVANKKQSTKQETDKWGQCVAQMQDLWQSSVFFLATLRRDTATIPKFPLWMHQ